MSEVPITPQKELERLERSEAPAFAKLLNGTATPNDVTSYMELRVNMEEAERRLGYSGSNNINGGNK